MDILAPLKNVNDIDNLLSSGVTELYFGFYDESWTKKFGIDSCINRMSNFAERANSISIEQVPEVVRNIHKSGAKCYITLNAAQYTTEEFKKIESYMEIFESEKPDGVIVSGVAMARLILHHHMMPIASTMCNIYNADIARFYSHMGVQRMIFPREVTTTEMKNIMEQCPEVEFEAFFMRNGCMFSDAACLGIHSREYGSLCKALCRSETQIYGARKDFYSVHQAEENSIIYHGQYRHMACGMCALYRLKEMGIQSLKIVGRADVPDAIIRDAALIRKNIEIATLASSESDYLNKMIFPPNRFHMCKNGLSCYYPEVRFSESALLNNSRRNS